MKYFTFKCGCKLPILSENPLRIDFNPDVTKMVLDCPRTWDLYAEGNCKGIFQLERNLGRSWAKKIRPRSIEEASDLIAIIRPGCLEAKLDDGKTLTEHYLLRKDGMEPVTYIHSSLEPILKDTYGILVYQEQMMEIAKSLAGYSLQQADALRKIVGKKLAELMAQAKVEFMNGCEKTQVVPKEVAGSVFDWIEKCQRYSFCRCVSGDTIIRRPNRGKLKGAVGYSVEHMYNIRNNHAYAKACGQKGLRSKWQTKKHYGQGLSMCEDGRIRPNVVKDIQPAGVRDVFKITLENGSTIRVTDNHNFPTPTGKRETKSLSVGDELYVCGKFEFGYNRREFKRSDATREDMIQKFSTKGRPNGGEESRLRTNGEFTKFKNSQSQLPNYCERCGSKNHLETHHKDRNWRNNEVSNLERLCNSCHKKADYALGRTKAGEKGYPSIPTKIVSIEPDGSCMTYDVTMDAPNHTFVANNDVVTCNSHSMAYAAGGYAAAYAKAHLVRPFFTSYLHNAHDGSKGYEEVKELVNNAKMNQVEIRIPDFRLGNTYFKLVDKVIYFGLSEVKGVGEGTIHKLDEVAKQVENSIGVGREAWTWPDIVVYLADGLKKNCMEALIRCGAFDYLKYGRRRMDYEYKAWCGLTDKEAAFVTSFYNRRKHKSIATLFDELLTSKVGGKGAGIANKNRFEKIQEQAKLLKKPPFSLEDTAEWLSEQEMFYLGTAVTCTKVEGCDVSRANFTCAEFNAGAAANKFCIAVNIDRVSEYEIKSGKSKGRLMAFMDVYDITGYISCVVFSDLYYKSCSMLTESNTILISGKRDSRKDSLVVEQLWQL